MRSSNSADAPDRIVAQPLFGLGETVEGGDNVALPGLAADGDCVTQGLGLDQLAHFGQVAEVVERGGPPKAALPLARHQRFAQ